MDTFSELHQIFRIISAQLVLISAVKITISAVARKKLFKKNHVHAGVDHASMDNLQIKHPYFQKISQ
jgi:hypothetical protein